MQSREQQEQSSRDPQDGFVAVWSGWLRKHLHKPWRGEAHNGILKTLETKLGIWKGGVPDPEFNDRWQELAWLACQ